MKLKSLCFEIIRKCPNNCKFCSSVSCINDREIINLELFKKTIDRFIEQGGIEELSISGGEPLLHPNIFDIISYAKENGIKTTLYTSGIMIDNTSNSSIQNFYVQRIINQIYTGFKAIDRVYLNRFKDIGLDKIIYDLQSIDEDNYNFLMGTKKLLPYVLTSMARSIVVGIPTEVNFVPLKKNINDLRDILDIASCGIEKVNLLRFIPQGRGKENSHDLMLSADELKDFLNDVNQYNGNSNIRTSINILNEDNHKCTAGLGKYIVRYDGTILPCAAFKDCDIELLKEHGINILNIKDEEFSITSSDQTRNIPLCKVLNRIN